MSRQYLIDRLCATVLASACKAQRSCLCTGGARGTRPTKIVTLQLELTSLWNVMMQPLTGIFRAGLCTVFVITSGCWTNARTRPQVANPPSVVPQTPQPELSPSEFGPSLPSVPSEIGPPLDGPTLEAPSFPQSSNDDDFGSQGFDRKRYTQQFENNDQPHFADVQPPIILDGPVAIERYEREGPPASRIGYVELPPAPSTHE